MAEWKGVCREIFRQEKQLAGEMNLRLLLEQPLDGEVLFVEDVTVTDICPAEKKSKQWWWKVMNWKDKVFANKKVNGGRQRELDLLKAMCIVCLALIHCTIECTPEEQLAGGIPYLFDTVIGGPLSAPVFMFAMGIGMVYTRYSKPREYVRRGLQIAIVGYLLNICRFLIPFLVGYKVTGDYEKYIAPLAYKVFGNDILQFASLAMLLIALFVKLHIPDAAMLLICLGMSLLGTRLGGISLGNPAANIIMGYFIGTEDA
ncbi:MAG: heparan-alpha-glucosaminide N-acetyltransferase domain-containing protein, partial [Acetatifactor sp.]|nr:heparan-alpha-glucosaminide N-acetyltransferase domain-containing protein [Acetatifactor sp.]